MGNKDKKSGLSIQELIGIVKRDGKAKRPFHDLNMNAEPAYIVAQYLTKREIGPGRAKTPFKEIFEDFKNWQQEDNVYTEVNRRYFGRLLMKHLPRVKDGRGVFYMINKNPLNDKKEN